VITPGDFDRIYAADSDPFRVGASWYERRKIDVVLACLAQQRYRRAWDAACGTGHLAAAVAERCDRLLATDASAEACRIAAARLERVPNTQVAVHELPAAPAHAGGFDLVLLSEVVYYLPAPDLDALAPMLQQETVTDAPAEIVVVNWRHHPSDAHFSGTDAVGRLAAPLQRLGWQSVVRHDDEDFLLLSWKRPIRPGR